MFNSWNCPECYFQNLWQPKHGYNVICKHCETIYHVDIGQSLEDAIFIECTGNFEMPVYHNKEGS